MSELSVLRVSHGRAPSPLPWDAAVPPQPRAQPGLRSTVLAAVLFLREASLCPAPRGVCAALAAEPLLEAAETLLLAALPLAGQTPSPGSRHVGPGSRADPFARVLPLGGSAGRFCRLGFSQAPAWRRGKHQQLWG